MTHDVGGIRHLMQVDAAKKTLTVTSEEIAAERERLETRARFERLLVIMGVRRPPEVLVGLLGGIGFRSFCLALTETS